MERERVREREPVHQEDQHYEDILRVTRESRERARNGKIVIKGKEQPWRQNRQGLIKMYLSFHGVEDTAADNWVCFIHDIKVHSGKHRHQGGIQLFVLEGEGYTVVDGERVDWEKGDLIILPVKPNGCEHQHFNKVPGQPAKWMAFEYWTYARVLGNLFEQVDNSPDWKEKDKKAAAG